MARDDTPDVLDHLAEVEDIAAQALADIADGRAVNGRAALRRIMLRARDAQRHEQEDRARRTDDALAALFHDDRDAQRRAGDRALAEAFEQAGWPLGRRRVA